MGRIGVEMAYERLDGEDGPPQRRIIDVRGRGPWLRGAARAMTAVATKLPPNPIRHFYRGGPAIAELRGIDVGSDHSPEEWIGSASTLFGESERGLSRLPDGSLVRDALAADPRDGWAPTMPRASAPSPALLVKLLDAGERLPVHHHPDGAFAREHLGLDVRQDRGVDRRRGRAGRAGRASAWREDVTEDTLRAWVRDAGPRRAARRAEPRRR